MKKKYLIVSLICLLVANVLVFIPQSESSEEKFQNSTNFNSIIAFSDITPIQSFNDIYSELDTTNADTLVVFDVDDVLITYNDMVLRPCGSRFYPESWKDLDPKEIPLLMSIMLSEGQIILIDPSIPQIINKLENKGVKIIALTAARTGKFGIIENAEDWRLKVLNQFNIDFSKSFSENKSIFFDNSISKEKNYSLFKDGILFLGDEKNNSKGTLLSQFLEKIQWKPKKIIFIDDKMSHLLSVEKALNEANIPFQGYLYRGVEMLPGILNTQIAEIQFSFLRKNLKWLSDSDAKKEEKCL